MKNKFKFVVVGNGVQGNKRKKIDKKNLVCVVDPIDKNADFRHIKEVPLNSFNSALVCTPDNQKIKIIEYLLFHDKNVLVEKPLIGSAKDLKKIFNIAKKKKLILYPAYNHRFEPNIIKVKNLIKKNYFGKIYSVNFFYGNGTSMLVKKSKWKDRSRGVLDDLGSHLMDLTDYLFKINYKKKFKIVSLKKFENKSPDYAYFVYKEKNMLINYEMTYCMWKNSFKLDLIGSKGSLHMDCLCKWGPSKLSIRKRVKPSGYPIEKIKVLKMKDPTWLKEHLYFKSLVLKKKYIDFSQRNIWISNMLQSIT